VVLAVLVAVLAATTWVLAQVAAQVLVVRGTLVVHQLLVAQLVVAVVLAQSALMELQALAVMGALEPQTASQTHQ
jgi:hypothetical protein